MKKILILTASTGQGHNQAADCLTAEIKNKGFEAIKYDFIKGSTKFMNSLIVDGYELLASKMPAFYGKIYNISDVEKINNNLLEYALTKVEKKAYKVIKEINPDVIIGTHAFSVSVVCKIKQKKNIDIPFISIITDYKAHYAYIDKRVDAYITGSDYTKEQLILKGIPRENIYSFGIPVSKVFYGNSEISATRLDDRFSVLLMGGSMGLKGIEKVLQEIINNKNNLKIIVVCGKNEELKRRLEDKFQGEFKNKTLKILGFTTNIPELMGLADIIITKPGGLTVSEAIAKKLPMILPFAIPGQETENAEFLKEEGAALVPESIEDINTMIDMLIENPNKILEIKNNISKLNKSSSLDNIVGLIEKLINEKEGNEKQGTV